jgi:hypothetical protein
MIAFVLWFVVLVGLCRVTRGWARGVFVTLYLVGSVLVWL